MNRSPVPKLTHHRASGQGVVRLAGRDHYVGPWGTKAARIEYDRLIAEWLANGRRDVDGGGGVTVAEVIAAFWDYAKAYYRRPDGTPTGEALAYRDAMKPLRRLYGHTPAAAFGPLALKAVRQTMIALDLCRTHINRRVGRIKHVLKWAVENELVPAQVYHGLQAVSGLKAGRGEARESTPVKPVPDGRVDDVIAVLSPSLAKLVSLQKTAGATEPNILLSEMRRLAQNVMAESPVAAMIQLQRLTGMRPGEVTTIRTCDIDTTGTLWVYRPAHHKTQHHGHAREIFLGPRAQVVLAPFLRRDLQAYIFSPADAVANHRTKLAEERTTPLSCGNAPGSNRKRRPRKSPTDRYHVTSYCRAIVYACEVAFGMPAELKTTNVDRPKPGDSADELSAKAARRRDKAAKRGAWHHEWCWHPHQLRHTAATELRKTFGLEAAQVILGHRTLTVTQVYAERNVAAAMQIMAKVG